MVVDDAVHTQVLEYPGLFWAAAGCDDMRPGQASDLNPKRAGSTRPCSDESSLSFPDRRGPLRSNATV